MNLLRLFCGLRVCWAVSFAKTVMPIAAIAMAVIKHGVVNWLSLHGLYNQLCLSQGNSVPVMSLPRHFF